jgi:taurine--2-oxoglutarate transaminase
MEKLQMTSDEIIRLNREYTFFSWTTQGAVNPIPIVRAEGVYLWDADGRRHLDFSAQSMSVNIGHSPPRIVAAIKEQADRLLYVTPGFATQVRGELGRLLAEITPGDLKKTFFTLGGAEATENAIKIARMFTNRLKIVTRYRSYHGATYGAVSAGPLHLPAPAGLLQCQGGTAHNRHRAGAGTFDGSRQAGIPGRWRAGPESVFPQTDSARTGDYRQAGP